MVKFQDMLLDEDMDVYAKNGDFAIGDPNIQNQKLIIIMGKGELKHSPETGVGIRSFILDDLGVDEVSHEIRKQFELDGCTVKNFTGSSVQDLKVEASYE